LKAEDFRHSHSWNRRAVCLVILHLRLLKQIVFFNEPGLPAGAAHAFAVGLGALVIKNLNSPMAAFFTLHMPLPPLRIIRLRFAASFQASPFV
jgi:hypothetical protein